MNKPLPTKPPALDALAPKQPKAVSKTVYAELLQTAHIGLSDAIGLNRPYVDQHYRDWIAGNLNRLLRAWQRYPYGDLEALSCASGLTIYQLQNRFKTALTKLHAGIL